MSDVTPSGNPSLPTTVVKLVVSAIAIIGGLFLVFGSTTPVVSDAIFVGGIALVLAVYLWPGVTRNQGRLIAVVLIFVAAYAFVRGFGLLELSILKQIGGIVAIVSGVILALPFIRRQFAKRSGS